MKQPPPPPSSPLPPPPSLSPPPPSPVAVKVAVMDLSESMVIVIGVVVPEASPLHPLNSYPLYAVAVTLTSVPLS